MLIEFAPWKWTPHDDHRPRTESFVLLASSAGSEHSFADTIVAGFENVLPWYKCVKNLKHFELCSVVVVAVCWARHDVNEGKQQANLDELPATTSGTWPGLPFPFWCVVVSFGGGEGSYGSSYFWLFCWGLQWRATRVKLCWFILWEFCVEELNYAGCFQLLQRFLISYELKLVRSSACFI